MKEYSTYSKTEIDTFIFISILTEKSLSTDLAVDN